jgi:hypothetical protein
MFIKKALYLWCHHIPLVIDTSVLLKPMHDWYQPECYLSDQQQRFYKENCKYSIPLIYPPGLPFNPSWLEAMYCLVFILYRRLSGRHLLLLVIWIGKGDIKSWMLNKFLKKKSRVILALSSPFKCAANVGLGGGSTAWFATRLGPGLWCCWFFLS